MKTSLKIAGFEIENILKIHLDGKKEESYVRFTVKNNNKSSHPMTLLFDVSDIESLIIKNDD